MAVLVLLAACDLGLDGLFSSNTETSTEQQPAVPSTPANPTSGSSLVFTGKDGVTASFSYQLDPDNPLLVHFTSHVQNPNNKPLSYLWMTDDHFEQEKDPSLEFQKGGKYLVKLYVIVDGDTDNAIEVPKEVYVGKIEHKFMHTGTNAPDSNPDYMYFALRVRGEDKDGGYKMAYSGAYIHDLEYQLQNRTEFTNSVDTQNFKAADYPGIQGYNTTTGFANADGTQFDLPFYWGVNAFRVKMNGLANLSYLFEMFMVEGGGASHISMRSGTDRKFIIPIPMDTYDTAKHKNIALITVDFVGAGSSVTYTTTFDGFVSR